MFNLTAKFKLIYKISNILTSIFGHLKKIDTDINIINSTSAQTASSIDYLIRI